MKNITSGCTIFIAVIGLGVLSGCKRNITSGDSITRDELELYCEMRERVFQEYYLGGYASCLWGAEMLPPLEDMPALTREIFECALEATAQQDEDSFYACFNSGHPREDCTAVDTTWCEGNVLRECRAPGEMWYADCSVIGEQCMYDEQWGENTCALPCPAGHTDGDEWCDGDWLYECEGELLYRAECSAIGNFCLDDVDGARCVPSTTLCDPEAYMPHCDGDVFVFCDWGGYLDEEDCGGNIYLTNCGTWNQQMGCIAETVSCTESHCDGDVANICIMGEPFIYDCTQLGLACVPDGSGWQVTCGEMVID